VTEPAALKPKELSCDACRELLSDYVDRELTPEEFSSVEHHLSTCQKCATESTRLQGLKNLLKNWDGVKGSSKFRDSIMQKYITESQMMQSKPFVDAAERAAAESQRATDNQPKPENRVALKAALAIIILGFSVIAILFAISRIWK